MFLLTCSSIPVLFFKACTLGIICKTKMQSVLTWSPTFNLSYHIQTEPKHNMDNHPPISEDDILTCRVIWQHCFPDVILQSTLILSSPQPHLFLLIKTISLFTRRLWFDVSTPPWLHYSCPGPQGAPLSPWWPCYPSAVKPQSWLVCAVF